MLKKGIQVLNSEILILGLTFKENCPDVRNTKVIDIYKALREFNLKIAVYDPWANPEIVKKEYDITLCDELLTGKFDTVILAVAHEKFNDLNILSLTKTEHVIFDVKAFLSTEIIDGRL